MTNENLAFKKKVLAHAIEKEQHLLDTIVKREKDDISQASDMSASDNENWRESREEEVIQRADMLAHRKEDAEKGLEALKRIVVDKQHSEIQFGTLILTSYEYWLVGTSLSEFKVDDKDIVGISMDAPIFEQLKGKKKGDIIMIGKKEVLIDDII